MKEKKMRLQFFDHASCSILSKKYKYLQGKVDQWLAFVAV